MVEINTETIIYLIVFLPLLGAIINGIFGKHLPARWVSIIGVGSVFLSAFFAFTAFFALNQIKQTNPENPFIAATLYHWITIGSVSIDLSFIIDPLSMVMVFVVTFVGAFIHLYSIGYMHGDVGYYRYFSYLNLFMFSMLMLVTGKNLLVLFVGWEGVGLCSYLLIGFWFTDMQKAICGKKAFIVNRIGDFGFLLALFIIIFYMKGSLDIPSLRESIAQGLTGLTSPAMITAVALLLFLGATGKSAQIPLYVWLPDAMAGPTPVSALIHAATMVTAGVYMIARLNFIYILSPTAMAVVAIVGAGTAFYSATIGLAQNDIKKVLAYSTISQLGYMFLGVGVGAFSAGIFHLMTHAFFKACLFLGAGSVIHALHHVGFHGDDAQDLRNMGGLRKYMPVTAYTMLIATMAIAGVPFLSGFFSKDEILWKTFATMHINSQLPWLPKVLFVIALAGAMLTALYMFRLFFLAFTGKERFKGHPHESPRPMTIILIVLAIGSVFAGYIGLPFKDINFFEHYLHPVFAKSQESLRVLDDHLLEFGLMGLSVLVALIGIGIAYLFYVKPYTDTPSRVALSIPRFYRLLMNKYYIDELYNLIFIKPLIWLCNTLYKFFETYIVDGFFVNGSAFVVYGIGCLGRLMANGEVQRYGMMILLGLAVIFYFIF